MRNMGRRLLCLSLLLLIGVIATLFAQSVAVDPRSFNYADALSKSILYFEAQRSGLLPPSQRVLWRGHSALHDGKTEGLDLTGGYYDAGDNVKFGLPMAFTATMLAWSVVEYGSQLQSRGELTHALDAIKWATDYFIKAHPEPNVFYGEVGDGASDHLCWMRPEDMTTSREAYRIDPTMPGSDLAAETAAALAAASIVFQHSNPSYSATLLTHAKQLFSFADTYRGKYDNSIMVARNFYASRSGYADELLWGAVWLYKATSQETYLKYLVDNAYSLGGTGWAMKEFSWDVKYAGVQVLASKILLDGKAGPYADTLRQYQQKAEYFVCAQLQGNGGSDNTDRTPGGLLYVRQWNNMQYVTASSFVLAVYADYLGPSGELKCPTASFSSSAILSFAKSQVDYILGHNPRSTSYMVGFGSSYPKQVHHRAASIVSYKVDSRAVGCKEGYSNWYGRNQDDPNVILGAIVGGPDENDNFADERNNYEQTEPATYNSGPLVGLLARFAGGSYNRQPSSGIPGEVKTPIDKPVPKPTPAVPKPKLRPPKATPKLPPKPTLPSSKPKPVLPGQAVPVVITQRLDGTWSSYGKTWHRYVVTVTNKSRFTVTDLVIRIKGYTADGEMWGLIKIGKGHNWILPDWVKSLQPGQAFDFVYIQPAQAATVAIRKYQLAK